MNLNNIIKNIFLRPRAFFLENLWVKQTIFKNTFWLVMADGITRLLKLFLFIYIARILGANEYGKFAFALAFVGLFAIFFDLGISQIVIREISRENRKEKEFPAILSLKLLLSVVTLFLILLGSFFITSDSQIQKIIWVLAIFSVIEGISAIIFSFFQAKQKMEYQAFSKILEAMLVTAFGFFILFNFPSAQNLSYAYLFSAFLTLIFISLFFHFKFFYLKFSFNLSIWKEYLSLAWPLALAGVFGTIYSQTDSVMMGYLGQISQVGWYNAAQKIIGVTVIPAALISTSFFPALNSAFSQSKEKFQKIFNYFFGVMIFLAFPIVVGGTVLAQKIIDFVYDPSYFPSILTFQILILMAGINMLSFPFGQILVVFNQQKKIFWITLSGAIVNVILNFILIPKYSLYGAAVATVITVFIVLFLFFQFTRKLTPIKIFNLKLLLIFIGATFAVIPMYFVITQPKIYHLHVFISILIGAVIYLICFLVYNFLSNRCLQKNQKLE